MSRIASSRRERRMQDRPGHDVVESRLDTAMNRNSTYYLLAAVIACAVAIFLRQLLFHSAD
jgi:hypothetical protein